MKTKIQGSMIIELYKRKLFHVSVYDRDNKKHYLFNTLAELSNVEGLERVINNSVIYTVEIEKYRNPDILQVKI